MCCLKVNVLLIKTKINSKFYESSVQLNGRFWFVPVCPTALFDNCHSEVLVFLLLRPPFRLEAPRNHSLTPFSMMACVALAVSGFFLTASNSDISHQYKLQCSSHFQSNIKYLVPAMYHWFRAKYIVHCYIQTIEEMTRTMLHVSKKKNSQCNTYMSTHMCCV